MTLRRMGGQSIVEFAVAAVSLSLLAMGAVMVARYQNIQLQTIVATRHAAFTHAWLGQRRPAAELQRRSQQLFFDNAGWRDPTGRQALLDARSIRIAASKDDAPQSVVAITQFLLQPLRVASGFLGGGFDLSARGLQRGRITVDVPPVTHMPAPFDQLRLQFDERYAVLGDAWNAGGPEQVASRTAGLVPTSLLDTPKNLLRPLEAPIRFLEPGFTRLCLGLIEPDGVPEDRLGPPLRAARAGVGRCR